MHNVGRKCPNTKFLSHTSIFGSDVTNVKVRSEVYVLCVSHQIVSIIKSRKMSLATHVAHMG
jgi:hypothetical protein